ADDTHDVEPARKPAPACATELRRPPVRATRGRKCGSQLRHRQRDEEDEGAEDRPPPRDRGWPAAAPGEGEVREAPREDRDDRERDREVREAAPRTGELL